MIFEKFLPKKFSTRLFLVAFIAGAIPILIFTVLISTYGKRIAEGMVQVIEEGYRRDNIRSAAMLREIGEASVYSKTLETAHQLDLVLESVPWMTLQDLRRDAKFRELAIQSISATGHTFLFDVDNSIVHFHRDRRLEKRHLYSQFKNIPEFGTIIQNSLKGSRPSHGYYSIKAGDGKLMERYLCVVPLHQLTEDGVRLMVAATVNSDDFAQRIDESQAIHETTKNFLILASNRSIQAFRHQGLLFMGIGIVTVSIVAFIVGIYFSRGVRRLREATERVNGGDYSTPVKVSGTGEVANLMRDFNRMVDQLASTTVSKQLLQASEIRLKSVNTDLRNEIKERQRTERALAEEKERLNVTLRSIGEGVITADATGKLILMNKAAEDLTGWQQDEALNRELREVFTTINEDYSLIMGNGQGKNNGHKEQEFPLNRKTLLSRNGSEKLIVETTSIIRDRTGISLGTVIVFRDITDQQRVEEELLKARKLESLGTLAGGIAHDFNNLLAVILGNISFAKMFMKPEDRGVARLIEAENACMRGKDLTYQLLAFARGGEPSRNITDVGLFLKDTVESCLSESAVAGVFSLPEEISPVTIDEKLIGQVIERIVGNAVEAMDGKGTLVVGTENITIGLFSQISLKPGEYVRLSIRDEGRGIPEDDLPRIFDPYFTKKEMGYQKGTGLGLSICYSIVKEHEGLITVESEEGKGTCFTIYLPAAQVDEDAQYDETPSVIAAPSAGKGKLLFMDDDEAVCDVVVEILCHLGYDTEYARDGSDAIDLYTKAMNAKVGFDVVVADLTVRDGMGGKELVENLRRIDPNVKAVISSGYSDDPVLNDFKKYGFIGVVAKPYKIEELCSVIDSIIRQDISEELEVIDGLP
jgi:PAS domain S-box-containing protein